MEYNWVLMVLVTGVFGALSGFSSAFFLKVAPKTRWLWWRDAFSLSLTGSLASIAVTNFFIDPTEAGKVIGTAIVVGFNGLFWINRSKKVFREEKFVFNKEFEDVHE